MSLCSVVPRCECEPEIVNAAFRSPAAASFVGMIELLVSSFPLLLLLLLLVLILLLLLVIFLFFIVVCVVFVVVTKTVAGVNLLKLHLLSTSADKQGLDL